MTETSSPLVKRERFIQLDSLRGLAACVIAFLWHYRHFGITQDQPFSFLLKLFYENGGLLVELFFIVSGFVMACGYKNKILSGQISFKNYMVKRYKHMYPLVFITLLVVTAEQFIILSQTGKTFIYKGFDVFHFVTNLLCIQSGWFENKMTFNGPAWCISIEILCYIAFFGVLFFLRKKNLQKIYTPLCCVICLLSFAAVSAKCKVPFFHYSYTGRGILCFFLGLLLFEAYKLYKDKAKKICMFAFPALLIMLVVGTIVVPDIFGNLRSLLTIFVYPILILSMLTLKPVKMFFSFKPFVFLGKCSMSIYLWHFPVQCLIKIICNAANITLNFHYVYVWAIYIAAVMAVSIASYFLIEKREIKLNTRFFNFLTA